MAKRTVEECLAIDINYLHRQGMLQPGRIGTLEWYRRGKKTGSIVVIAYSNTEIGLRYCYKAWGRQWDQVYYTVQLTWTPCHFGGHRPWFLCPRCGRRVGKLYAGGKYFLCRHCYDLAYQSQRESYADRLLRRAWKLRAKLGLKPWEPIVEKPPRMHWKAFLRLREEIQRLELEALDELHRDINRLAKRVERLLRKSK